MRIMLLLLLSVALSGEPEFRCFSKINTLDGLGDYAICIKITYLEDTW